jgi:predicted enzyme related to lactoylglutathione lyase
MSRLTWFEIHAEEPARAMRFYGSLFGWSFDSFGDDYWLIHTGEAHQPGIDGGLLPRRGPAPSEGQPVNAYTCVVSVVDVDDAVAKIPPSAAPSSCPSSRCRRSAGSPTRATPKATCSAS